MTTLQSSGLEPEVRLKSLKNAKRRVMPGEEEIQNLDQFNPDIAGTANPMPAPKQNMPQSAIGGQVSAQSYDPRANQVMTAPPQPVMANPNPPQSQENLGTQPPVQAPGTVEKKLGENLPAAVGIQQPQGQSQAPVGNVAPNFSKDRGYGLREDGTHKGKGFYGEMPMKDGQHNVFGEISISEDLDGSGRQILMPSVVPGLSAEQLDALSKDTKNSFRPDIYKIVVEHARNRIAQGLPTFATEAEEGQTPIPTPEEGKQAPAEREGLFTRFGKALAMQGGFPPGQKELPEKYKPIPESEGALAKGYREIREGGIEKALEDTGKNIGDIASLPRRGLEKLDPYVDPYIEKAINYLPGWGPKPPLGAEPTAEAKTSEMAAQTEQGKAEQEQRNQQEIDRAQQNPWQITAYGATDMVANQPELRKALEKMTGTAFTPEMEQGAKTAEKVLPDIENGTNPDLTGYDEQAKRLYENILSNKATDADKYMIGLALAMPLIIGGIFGKEAGFGALAGGMKGMGESYGRREKAIREDEELLAKVNKERGDITAATAKEQAAKSAVTEGMKKTKWTDQRTGEEIEGVLVKPGYAAYPEYLVNKDDRAEMKKEATEINKTKKDVQEINDLTEDVIELSSQVKNKNPIRQAFIGAIKKQGYAPGFLSQVSDQVDFNGRKVNAGILLELKLGLLASAYARAKKLGQLDRAAQAHLDKIMMNPETSLVSTQDSIDNMMEIRKNIMNGFAYDVYNAGFSPEVATAEFKGKNKDLYGKLNKREEKKAIKSDKMKMMESE